MDCQGPVAWTAGTTKHALPHIFPEGISYGQLAQRCQPLFQLGCFLFPVPTEAHSVHTEIKRFGVYVPGRLDEHPPLIQSRRFLRQRTGVSPAILRLLVDLKPHRCLHPRCMILGQVGQDLQIRNGRLILAPGGTSQALGRVCGRIHVGQDVAGHLRKPLRRFERSTLGGPLVGQQLGSRLAVALEQLDIRPGALSVFRQVTQPHHFGPTARGGKVPIVVAPCHNARQHVAGRVQSLLQQRACLSPKPSRKLAVPGF